MTILVELSEVICHNKTIVVFRMLQENLSEALIAECTGLTLDEVQALAATL